MRVGKLKFSNKIAARAGVLRIPCRLVAEGVIKNAGLPKAVVARVVDMTVDPQRRSALDDQVFEVRRVSRGHDIRCSFRRDRFHRWSMVRDNHGAGPVTSGEKLGEREP